MDNLTTQLADALRGGLTPTFAQGAIDKAHAVCVAALAAYDAAQLTASMDAVAAGTSKALRDGTLAGTAGAHTAEPWGHSARIAGLPNLSTVYQQGDGTAHLSIAETCNGAHAENARRIVACVNACAGIPTEQLESMNAIETGALASAYDAASAIVEAVGFDTLEDEDALGDVSSDATYSAVSDASEYAVRACNWSR